MEDGRTSLDRLVPLNVIRGSTRLLSAPEASLVADPETALGPVKLLVLQGTNFCNIDCRYCYLPNRDDRGQMSVDTVRVIIDRLLDERLLKGPLLVNWHAGEPLVLRPEFYKERLRLFEPLAVSGIAVTHSLQTNGMLISDEYCELFKQYDIKVGVSIDGPAFIHDLRRVTRAGKGTHAATLRGIAKLQAAGIPFNAICVLSDVSVRHPREIYAFFREHDIRAVAFNIEEIEGANRASSITADGFDSRYREFLEVFWDLMERDGRRLRVREFDDAEGRITDDQPRRNSQTDPFVNLTIGWQGDFATFCPELLGNSFPGYPSSSFGNVHTSGFREGTTRPLFQRMLSEIRGGVIACERECDYFAVCGGGNPSNKISENGTFLSTATRNCQSRIKTTCDFVLAKIEQRIAALPQWAP
jgi:uncharacterized protein